MYQLQQSSTTRPLLFLMVDAADHITGKTGLSPTVTLSKNGGAFASPSGAVTEVANGWYKVAGNATDTNTLGPLVLHATATGADPTDVVYDVVAFNPHDAVRLGLSALPNASAGASGGVPTVDANNAVKVQSGSGANQILLSAGQVTVGTNNDKINYRLSAAGVDDILDEPITEPGTVFSWGAATLRAIIAWLGALSSNKTTQTSLTQVVRNRADSSNISTCTVSDDGTTFVRGSYV